MGSPSGAAEQRRTAPRPRWRRRSSSAALRRNFVSQEAMSRSLTRTAHRQVGLYSHRLPGLDRFVSPGRIAMTTVDRRTFLSGLGAASAFTIVPRRVLGGPGYVAPSDMILLAQVGCGTQAQRQVNTGMVARPDLQFVAVVDPNRDSQTTSTGAPAATARACGASSRTDRGAPATPASAPAATSRKRSWRPSTGSSTARRAASAPTKTTARCSRRKPTSRASSTSRPIISTAASTSRR